MANDVNVLINGRQTLTKAADEALGGIRKLTHGLESTKSSLRAFNSLFELGFGVGVGVKFFEKIHDAAARAVEGFNSARHAGMGFVDSLEVGIDKSLGFRSALDRAADSAKHYKEIIGDLTKSKKELDTSVLFGTSGFAPNHKYKYLPNAKEAEDKVNTLQAELDKRQLEMKPYYDEKRRLLRLRDSSDTMTGRGYANRELAALEKEWEPTIIKMGATDSDLFAAKNKLAELNARWDKFTKRWPSLTRFVSGGWSGDPTIGGSPLTTAGMLRTLRESGTGITSRIDDAASNGASGLIGTLLRGAMGGANPSLPPEINARIAALQLNQTLSPEQKRMEAAKIAQSFGSFYGLNRGDKAAPGVGADNQRFLTRGSGPVKTPELTALEKIAKALQDAGLEKLPDLLTAIKKFGPIGVVDDL